MRAYNIAMAQIFISCGFVVSAALGVFGNMSEYTGIYQSLMVFADPWFTIGPITFNGITAIAILMVGATTLVLNSRLFSSEGVAIGVFAAVFWGSFAISSTIFGALRDGDGNPFPGLLIFVGIYGIASALIFVIALVQMPTGGQKSHV